MEIGEDRVMDPFFGSARACGAQEGGKGLLLARSMFQDCLSQWYRVITNTTSDQKYDFELGNVTQGIIQTDANSLRCFVDLSVEFLSHNSVQAKCKCANLYMISVIISPRNSCTN